MASAKEKAQRAQSKRAEKPSLEAKPQQSRAEPDEARSRYIAIGIVAIVAVLVVAVMLLVVPQFTGVPFQTFKANFNSAQRVALAVTFYNESQYIDTSPCYTSILEIVARSRNASSIDLYLLNQTKCTFSTSGLGHSVNVTTVNASVCIGLANSEPSIFLNYSSVNYTRISPSHLYVGGNPAYLSSCPVAAEFG